MVKLKEFLLSINGMALALFIKIFFTSVFLCLGVHLFDCKKLPPFFSLKKILSLFFILLAIRIFYSALFFFLEFNL